MPAPPPNPALTAMAGSGRVPQHIAIVMDGNGRWAQRRGRPRTFGHRAGAKAVRLCVRFCLERGVGALTLFAFSSENWKRPQEEVGALMNLFMRSLDREVDELHEHGVRLHFIGDRMHLSAGIRKRMESAEQRTAGNTRLRMNVAISYGGRWDIVQAARTLAQAAVRGQIDLQAIDEATFAQHVELAAQPAPDLFIRTGGDRRISNFLLWQMAYTELWFTDTLWPDLDASELDRALADFAARERRFGLTGAQVTRDSGA